MQSFLKLLTVKIRGGVLNLRTDLSNSALNRVAVSVTADNNALPTIIIMFILRVGQFMTVGYDKILLLYNSSIYETADVISTFVYRKGIVESNFSFSAAVGVFNSLVNFVLVVVVNKISAKVSETSLW